MALQLTVFFAFIVLGVIPGIFYLVTLQKTAAIISPESRRLQPKSVWLLLIPFFNIVWHFIVVSRLSASIKNECLRLQVTTTESRPTYVVGMASMLSYLVGVPMRMVIPITGVLGSLAGYACWIMYWIDVNKYRKLILANKDNFLLDIERETATFQ
jgi:hypothetical protein